LSPSVSALQRSVRRALAAAADPGGAAAMQAYMKSAMPYLGASAPAVRAVCREVFAAYPFADAESWRVDVLGLWRGAKHREERYAAIALSGQRKAQPFQTLAALPMYQELIVSGAWWDYVDEVAAHRVGPLLRSYPRELRREMLTWSRSRDMWQRRRSIICQLSFKEVTDLKLLFACIEPSLASKEFFLRKAIGWALRQVARHDPGAVKRYVKERARLLSGRDERRATPHPVARHPGETRQHRRAPQPSSRFKTSSTRWMPAGINLASRNGDKLSGRRGTIIFTSAVWPAAT
jgi:3-methyladenine DNA glycosylase AlkD